MLAKNQFTRYLFYAIGEIILVVIGILIALQINNQNEARKQEIREIGYLNRLLVDLEKDRQLWINTYARKQTQINAAYQLFDFSIQLQGTQNTLSMTELAPYFRPATTWRDINTNQSTYTELLSSGNLDLVKNDSIKIKLLDLDSDYQVVKNWDETIEREHIRLFDALTNILGTIHFIPFNEEFLKYTGRSFTPEEKDKFTARGEKDLKALLTNRVFINSLNGMVDNHSRQLDLLKELENSTQDLILLIQNELQARGK
jgi:hypothetical protein